MNNTDTIFALSSGAGKAGVAVIRISGENLRDMFMQLSGRSEFDARRAYFTKLRDVDGELIDTALLLYFAAPHSFTGTDIIEIHSHGAPAVVEKIFSDLTRRGARIATPGEFSRRAFNAGKMDLTDVDGLAALLSAQTERQRQFALKSMLGGDSDVYAAWRAQMVEISAYAAAILDYDADDLPANIGDKITAKTRQLYDEINNALSRYAAVRAVRGGFNITLAGPTNVGKSSLFNRIVGTNRAIVSDIAGTTRDVVSASLDIDGYLTNISDTAGLRDDAIDVIEKIGMDRTRDEIENADLVLRVTVANAPDDINANVNEIVVVNKSDLNAGKKIPGAIYVSAITGDGMDDLMHAIRTRMHEKMDTAQSGVAVNARTHALLTDAAENLGAAIAAGANYDIFAEHTRRAADAVGQILGIINAAEVMDATFSQLCLGK